jgi:hypothetical protein
MFALKWEPGSVPRTRGGTSAKLRIWNSLRTRTLARVPRAFRGSPTGGFPKPFGDARAANTSPASS